jgi:hypothetical protein
VSSGAPLARIVEQPLCDIFPDCLSAVDADRIDSLDFHGPLATAAGGTQYVPGNIG